jgi:hypothetical protein
MAIKTIPDRKHIRQMLAYPDSAVGFIQTQFYSPSQFHGDAKVKGSNIQDLHLKLILSVLEVYK